MKECVFCKIVGGEVSADKIYENGNFFSIFDKDPEVEGHALVICKKHFETVLDLPESLGSELMDAIKKTTIVLVKKYGVSGFNFINNCKKIAGQVIPHFHVHIIPRREGDNFRCWNLKKKLKSFEIK